MAKMSVNRARVIVHQWRQIALQLAIRGEKLPPKAAAALKAAESRIEEAEEWSKERRREESLRNARARGVMD